MLKQTQDITRPLRKKKANPHYFSLASTLLVLQQSQDVQWLFRQAIVSSLSSPCAWKSNGKKINEVDIVLVNTAGYSAIFPNGSPTTSRVAQV